MKAPSISSVLTASNSGRNIEPGGKVRLDRQRTEQVDGELGLVAQLGQYVSEQDRGLPD